MPAVHASPPGHDGDDGAGRSGPAAVAALFAVNGALLASWVARIPARQESLGLGEGALGLVLLGLAAGTVVTLPVAGGLVGRHGAWRVSAGGLVVAAVALPLPAVAAGPASLAAALVLLGAGLAAMDVGMNVQGVVVEHRAGRSVMVALHGLWSVGALAGAGAGSLAIAAGVTTGWHLAGAAAGLLAVGSWALAASRDVDTTADHAAPRLALPRGPLWPLAGVALLSALGEGAVADWAGVHLRQGLDAAPAVAPLGFLAFAATMAGARFVGDRLRTRYGPSAVIRAGGALAAAGYATAVAAPSAPVAIGGFAVVGAGLASVIPLTFAAAGNVEGIPEGVGVAAVSTIGYGGFLAGPPLVGLVAETTGLSAALLLVAGLVAALTVAGRASSLRS